MKRKKDSNSIIQNYLAQKKLEIRKKIVEKKFEPIKQKKYLDVFFDFLMDKNLNRNFGIDFINLYDKNFNSELNDFNYRQIQQGEMPITREHSDIRKAIFKFPTTFCLYVLEPFIKIQAISNYNYELTYILSLEEKNLLTDDLENLKELFNTYRNSNYPLLPINCNTVWLEGNHLVFQLIHLGIYKPLELPDKKVDINDVDF